MGSWGNEKSVQVEQNADLDLYVVFKEETDGRCLKDMIGKKRLAIYLN